MSDVKWRKLSSHAQSQTFQAQGSLFLSACAVPNASGYDLSQEFYEYCNASKSIKSDLQCKSLRIKKQVCKIYEMPEWGLPLQQVQPVAARSFCSEAILLRLWLEPAFCRWNLGRTALLKSAGSVGQCSIIVWSLRGRSQWSSLESQLLPALLMVVIAWQDLSG